MKTSLRYESPLALFPLFWGVLGFAAFLGTAIYRLAPFAIEPINDGMLNWWQWGLYGLWVFFMAYTEGYKGFQVQMSPRVVARGMHLVENPKPLHVILAPVFVMSLFHASRKRLIVSWSLLVGIVILVIIVRQFDQPWRGIVDGGVVVGLSWGVAAMLWYFAVGLTGRPVPATPELPGE